jgi:hypothetical protein
MLMALLPTALHIILASSPALASASIPPAGGRLWTHEERHQHHLNAAGLHEDGSTAPPKCEGQCMPPFPTTQKGIFFSGAFTNHTVLQRGTEAAVYGVVVGATASSTVSVAISGKAEDGTAESLSGVTATIDSSTVPKFGYSRWKAVLPSHQAGGNFSVSATCTGCSGGQTVATISGLTYGDVWFCSGQVSAAMRGG